MYTTQRRFYISPSQHMTVSTDLNIKNDFFSQGKHRLQTRLGGTDMQIDEVD